jgi:hypothetical protein
MVEEMEDQRCRYRGNETRLGPCANHLAIFSEANGEYIAILNHDDVWEKAFLSTLVAALDHNSDIVLAFCDHNLIDVSGAVLEAETERNSRYWKRDETREGLHRPFDKLFVDQTIPIAMGSVFRRSAVDWARFSMRAGPAYDLWLAYLLCKSGGAAYFIPERLSNWRVHSNNLTGQGGPDGMLGDALCWEAVVNDSSMTSIREIARKKASSARLSLAKWYIKHGPKLRAIDHILQASRDFIG